MLALSEASIIEKNKLSTDGVWLLALEAQIPGNTLYLVNNTGEKMSARAESKLDGKEYITSVFVEAVSTNKGGIRDVIKGVR